MISSQVPLAYRYFALTRPISIIIITILVSMNINDRERPLFVCFRRGRRGIRKLQELGSEIHLRLCESACSNNDMRSSAPENTMTITPNDEEVSGYRTFTHAPVVPSTALVQDERDTI